MKQEHTKSLNYKNWSQIINDTDHIMRSLLGIYLFANTPNVVIFKTLFWTITSYIKQYNSEGIKNFPVKFTYLELINGP